MKFKVKIDFSKHKIFKVMDKNDILLEQIKLFFETGEIPRSWEFARLFSDEVIVMMLGECRMQLKVKGGNPRKSQNIIFDFSKEDRRIKIDFCLNLFSIGEKKVDSFDNLWEFKNDLDIFIIEGKEAILDF